MRATTTSMLGAVCEMLSEMLEQQSHSRDHSSNPYLTHDDFEKLRDLEGRVRELRGKAGCPNFVTAATKLLAEEAARYAECATALRALSERWQAAERSHASVIREVADSLALETYLCVWADPGHPLKTAFERIAPNLRIGQRPLAGDVVADAEGFRANERRLSSCVSKLKSALDKLTQEARELESRSRAEIQAIRDRVVERRVIVALGDRDPEAKTDLGTLGAQGNQYAFLAFTTPPKLSHFECDSALGMYLNVAEDVASGAISLQESRRIGGSYKDFMDAVTGLDRQLSEALSLDGRSRERLAAAEAFQRVATAQLTPRRIDEAAATIRDALAKAKAMLTRAHQLATIGDLKLAAHIRSVAVQHSAGMLTADAVDAAIAEQEARAAAMRRSFALLESEATHRTSGWQLTLHELLPFLDSHADLRTRLDEFFSHQKENRWGPGSALSHSFIGMVRKCRPWCDLVNYKATLRPWALLHDSMTRCKPRPVQRAFAFVNALCAMAHAHDGLSEEETSLIKSITSDEGIVIDSKEHADIILGWQRLPRDQRTLAAIAQAINDVTVIGDVSLLERLDRALRRVAQADGDLAANELAVYHGFVTTITRCMHPTFSQ